MPKAANNDPAYRKGQDRAKQSLTKSHTDPDGIWNQHYLKRHPNLVKLLDSFIKGERGASVRHLSLANKRGSEIHRLLMDRGFHFDRVPLRVGGDANRLYWRMDGGKTRNPQDEKGVFMYVYWHNDGGIVRVKPVGVPSQNVAKPEPQVSKSVAWRLKKKKLNKGDQKNARIVMDTSARNEAFKVSESGMPVPKSPGLKSGIRFLYKRDEERQNPLKKQEERGWIDTIMAAGHMSLPADFSACRKGDKK